MARQRRQWTALLARIASDGSFDLSTVRQTRVRRQIQARMESRRVGSFREYVRLLQTSPGEYVALTGALKRAVRRTARASTVASLRSHAELRRWVSGLPIGALAAEALPGGRRPRVLACNQAARELLGSPQGALQATAPGCHWLKPDATPCQDDDLPLHQALKQQALAGRGTFLLRDASERLRPIVVDVFRLPGRRPVALVTLQTAGGEAPGPLPAGRYLRLFEESPSALLLTAADGTIIDANARARLLFQADGTPLTGSSLSEHVTPGSLPALRCALDALASGEAEARLNVRAHPELTFEARVRPIWEGEQALAQWALHDVTFHVATEQLRGDLLDLVLHDLRSPLATSILGVEAAERNLQREEPAKALRSLDMAGAALHRLGRLVDSLLDVSRLEAGQPIIRLHQVNVEELFQELRREVQLALAAHKLELELELAPGLPTIVADGDMLFRAVMGLLDNAIKFSPGESRIWVRVTAQDYGLLITVTDQGPGIPRELQPRIFDKFVGLHLPQGPRSYGLGLAFCKLAVEAHHGWVAVDSTPGQGSTFALWVPANPELPHTD
ncbi:MAG: ATP-binding protein [Anaerolineae bacterium]|nr:ATP-binding protein [Anaerolineae bacterium]